MSNTTGTILGLVTAIVGMSYLCHICNASWQGLAAGLIIYLGSTTSGKFGLN